MLGLLFQSPSEVSFLWGYSLERWLLGAGVLLVLLILAVLLAFSFLKPDWSGVRWQKLSDWLSDGQHLLAAALLLSAIAIFSLGGWIFTYLFIPVHLRWILVWLALICTQTLIWLVYVFRSRFASKAFYAPLNILPKWSHLERSQKRTFWLLFAIGLVYFLAFCIPNALDARDAHELFLYGGDENITYPYVVWMLTPADTFAGTVYQLFVYEDYHYGYPFYVLSMLVLLPSRLIFGLDFAGHTQLNLLLLRQFVSVLPMILATGILVFLQTRFRSRWKSVALFLLILLLPAVVKYNLRFWHPDGLVVLCVALTLYFLQRDRWRFRHNFFLAALMCGLASAIKLFGFFFFLSIAGYLLVGLWQKKITFRRASLVSFVFLLLMFGTLIFSNPFLFVSSARERLVWMMGLKADEMKYGYDEPDPEQVYQKGFSATLPALEGEYAPRIILVYTVLSLLFAFIYGKNRLANGLLAGWVLLTAFYLFTFVAIKNYHYWLPTMLPFFSTFWGLPEALAVQKDVSGKGKRAMLAQIGWGVAILLLLFQLSWSLYRITPYLHEWERVTEIALRWVWYG